MIATRRHLHSPRVRRLARDQGVVLDGLVGSGPRGRVTTADVLRAGDHVGGSTGFSGTETGAVQPSGVAPATGASRTTVVIEVDVTRLATGAHALLAAVIEAAAAPFRQALPDRGPGAGIDVVAHAGARARTIRDADRLSMAGLLHALELSPGEPRAGTDAGPRHGQAAHTLAVHDVSGDGFLYAHQPMAGGDLAVMSVGVPVERAAVIIQPDGERGIGVRTFVHLALTYDERMPRAGVARLLTAVRARLEAPERLRVGGGSS